MENSGAGGAGDLEATDAERRGAPEDAVQIPLEDSLDLHAFAPGDVPSVVTEYVEEAARRGLVEVRLIHGRGRGVQRAAVHGVLAAHPRVARFFEAPPDRGGWGATVAVLRPAERGEGRDGP